MKPLAAMVGLIVLVGAVALWWPRPAPQTAAPVDAEPSAPAGTPEVSASGAAPAAAFSDPGPTEMSVPEPDRRETDTDRITLNAGAVASLRQAREQGEPRTPPLAEPAPERILPSQEELADPDLYLEYEARQKQQVFASFLQASEKKVDDLRQAIQRAESEGMPEQQLAEGREKLKRLEALRAELLRDHPSLSDDAGETGAVDGQAESSP